MSFLRILQAADLGHQIGQAAERRWWHQGGGTMLEPVEITTPGWGPTGIRDHRPMVWGTCAAMAEDDREITPEAWRDFLLSKRGTWLLQGAQRTSLELMAEGMNPRITGLYVPSVATAVWTAIPAGLYYMGQPEEAWEYAVRLARPLNAGAIADLCGAFAYGLAAPSDEKMWPHLLKKLRARNPKAAGYMKKCMENMDVASDAAWKDKVSDEIALTWMASVYAAFACAKKAEEEKWTWELLAERVNALSESRAGAWIALSLYAARTALPFPKNWQGAHQNAQAAEKMEMAVRLRRHREAEVAREQLSHADDLEDRMLAAMLAGDYANALGSPVEDRDYTWIEDRYGVVEHLLDAGRFDTEDDAAMAKMWLDTILAHGRIYPEDLANTLMRKMEPKKFYYDSHVAYGLAAKKTLPAFACGHWNVVTGSALMGCYGIGFLYAGDGEAARRDTLELSYHYQRGFDVHAAGILAAACAEALRPGATIDSVIEAAIQAAPEAPQPVFDDTTPRSARLLFRSVLKKTRGLDVLAARPVLYDAFRAYNGQDPWEVVAYTLAIFQCAGGDVWQAAIGGANVGRDSDTIACQAALLSACLGGTKAVPAKITEAYSPESMARTKRYAREMRRLIVRRAKERLERDEDAGSN